MILFTYYKSLLGIFFLLFSFMAIAQIDMSSMPASVGSCESITQVAAQRAGGDYQRGEALRSLSRKFMDLGIRLHVKNSNDGILYINSKNIGYENALNLSDSQLNASVTKCLKLAS
jgi:hypothetical protein